MNIIEKYRSLIDIDILFEKEAQKLENDLFRSYEDLNEESKKKLFKIFEDKLSFLKRLYETNCQLKEQMIDFLKTYNEETEKEKEQSANLNLETLQNEFLLSPSNKECSKPKKRKICNLTVDTTKRLNVEKTLKEFPKNFLLTPPSPVGINRQNDFLRQ